MNELLVNKKILVVMGGTSSESEVSLASGAAMHEALVNCGYNATKFISNDNNIADILKEKPDLVVLALHGKGGEDGTIQGFLDLVGIPYTGPGALSSAMCMNKAFTKKVLEHDGIRTARCIILSHKEFDAKEVAEKAINEFGLPVVVKASSQGSSVGVEIARTAEELPEIINRIYEYDNELLIEEFLPGMELSVPVLKEKGTIKVLPPVEITFSNEFYDYDAKYTEGQCTHIVPARLSDDVIKEIEELTKDVYTSLNCQGLVRVDFLLDKDEKPYAVEVNTIPGMRRVSLAADSAKSVGISFEELIEKIALMGLENR